MFLLVNIIVGETYSALDSSTKPKPNNFAIWAWTKALSLAH
jgi:hypothetical protein